MAVCFSLFNDTANTAGVGKRKKCKAVVCCLLLQERPRLISLVDSARGFLHLLGQAVVAGLSR
jgi:hypothetical protein